MKISFYVKDPGGLRHFQKEESQLKISQHNLDKLNSREPHSGRLSVSRTDTNVNRFQELVHGDHQLMVKMIGTKSNLSHINILQIFTNKFNELSVG